MIREFALEVNEADLHFGKVYLKKQKQKPPNFIETEKEWRFPGAREREKLLFNGHRLSVWENENPLEVDAGDVCTTM